MSLAEPAILLDLHPVRMCLLLLCRIVIALLALCTCQCNLCTHNPTSASVLNLFNIFQELLFLNCSLSCKIPESSKLHKKKTSHSSCFSTIPHGPCRVNIYLKNLHSKILIQKTVFVYIIIEDIYFLLNLSFFNIYRLIFNCSYF